MRGGEAIATLNRMQAHVGTVNHLLGEVEDLVAEVNQDGMSPTLNLYSAQIGTAHELMATLTTNLEDIKRSIEAGQTHGERYIRILLS